MQVSLKSLWWALHVGAVETLCILSVNVKLLTAKKRPWWKKTLQTAPLYLSSTDWGNFCHSRWRRIWLSVHYLWLRCQLQKVYSFTVTNRWTKDIDDWFPDNMFFPIALDWTQWGVWLSFGPPVPSRDTRVQNILPAAQEGVCEALLLGETETGRDWPGETQPGKDTLLTSWPLVWFVSTKRNMWVLQIVYNCTQKLLLLLLSDPACKQLFAVKLVLLKLMLSSCVN